MYVWKGDFWRSAGKKSLPCRVRIYRKRNLIRKILRAGTIFELRIRDPGCSEKRCVGRKQAIKLDRTYRMIINSATEQSYSEADSHADSQAFPHFLVTRRCPLHVAPSLAMPWASYCTSHLPFEDRNHKFRPDPDSSRPPNWINCTSAVVRLISSWWWAEKLPETCRAIVATNK